MAETMLYRFNSSEFQHYGVLGMKWGVWNEETKARRAARKTMRAQTQAAKEKASAEQTKLNVKLSKGRTLSNEEIRRMRDIISLQKDMYYMDSIKSQKVTNTLATINGFLGMATTVDSMLGNPLMQKTAGIFDIKPLAIAGKALEVSSREMQNDKDRVMRAAEKDADLATRKAIADADRASNESIKAADRAAREIQSQLDREARLNR